MDFKLSDELESFRQEVRDFLAQQLPSDWLTGGAPEDETDEWWEFTQKFLRAVADKGWMSMSWPKAYGGQERPSWEDAILGEELAYYRAPAMDYWFRWKMISTLAVA